MAFVYNPESVKTWSNDLVKLFNGESDSVSKCTKDFGDLISQLVQPEVWTGSAAYQNYQNFLDTHKALVAFSNEFGQEFATAMNQVASSVAELETTNLGDASVSTTFGELSFTQLENMADSNIIKDLVTYDYGEITRIAGELKKIKETLDGIKTSILSKINELNSGSAIWDGDAAESAKESLSNIVNTNMSEIYGNLDICISNINTAATAAQNADSVN